VIPIPPKEELEAIRDRTRKATVEERDRIADEYIEQGASGTVFEYMYRGGWRPRSQRAGDGIIGGDLTEVAPLQRRRKK